MRLTDTIKRAGRSLRQSKARTLLTSLAIGVGAFTIVLSLAAGAGGRQYAHDLISANTDVHELRVSQKQANGAQTSTPKEYAVGSTTQSFGNGFKLKLLSQKDIRVISKVDGVKSVEPAYNLDVQYVTRAGQKKYQASASTFNESITQNYLAGNGQAISKSGVIIPDSYRKVLGFGSPQAAIDQTISVVVQKLSNAAPTQPDFGVSQPQAKSFSLTIRGVYSSSSLSFITASSLEVSGEMAKKLYDYNLEGTPNYGQYMTAVVRTKDTVDAQVVKDNLSRKGYDAQTAKDIMGTLFDFINVLQGILLGFGALAVLTSVFGIINTQYISVLERTSQIGLMKALGMRRRDVGRLFKLEAAWIGFIGGVIGSAVAIIAGTIANPYIAKALSLQKGTDLLIFEPLTVGAVIIGLMIVSVAAGILPARKAARLDPIEALRTE